VIDVEGRTHPRIAYCNEIVAIRPKVARAALLLASPPDDGTAWPVLVLDGGELAVFGGHAPDATPAAALWAARGELRTGRRRSFPIEVELHPWSDHRSELGLRPAGRRWPPGWYFPLVSEAMARLRRELVGLTTVAAPRLDVVAVSAHPAGTGLRRPAGNDAFAAGKQW
jgi:hypothetical protein